MFRSSAKFHMDVALKLGKPVLELQMYRPMLVTLIHEFVDLHRTGRFLVGVCQRHSTAMCNAAQIVKQLRDVESMFEKAFDVRIKKMDASGTVVALVNTAMQLGMTYDYILYLNLVISRMHTVIQHLQSYMLYYLVLNANGNDAVLSKVQKLDEKCVVDLKNEWAKTTSLNEADYVINFHEGLGAVLSDIQGKLKAGKKSARKLKTKINTKTIQNMSTNFLSM